MTLACWSGGAAWALAQQPAAEQTVRLLRSDSRTPYVHRITLYDHDGVAIDPTDELAGPYSPRTTCAKCHDYGAISAGWHFNSLVSTIPGGRPGEPWLLVDPLTGTQLPISGRKWPGTLTPEEIGLTRWQFVLRFGRHTPGGGFGEPTDEEIANSPQAIRWGISGKLEIDCMFCHSADFQHDPAEAARQIEAQNFKWAPTAALGLAAIRGEARKVPDDWDPFMPPNPDFPEQAGPQLVWNTSRFDPDDRVFFNITRRPPNERCYFCHSFRQVGPDATPRMLTSQDVHLAAGLLCVDCHRHGLDHMMTRGYRAEAVEVAEPWRAAFSCEGCHLGSEAAGGAAAQLGGRYGAPHPQHRGLPPLHFEKLTCTTCHSGPWPGMYAKRSQTALAHGLGLATREREEDDPPHIVEPIFAREPDGRIAPQQLAWPAYFARFDGGDFHPVSPDDVREAAAEVLKGAETSLLGDRSAKRDDLVKGILEALAQRHEEPVFYAYFRGSRIRYGPWPDADIPVRAAPPRPYHWPIAHNVRPASQSLGVVECTDCHADGAPVYFGSIHGRDSAWNGGRPRLMCEFRGERPALPRTWALGFTVRPTFKVFGIACAALVALVLIRNGLQGFRGDGGGRRGFSRYEHGFHFVAIAGVMIQVATGFVVKGIVGELAGWTLLAHMAGGGLFILGFTGTVLQWAPRCRFGRDGAAGGGLTVGQRLVFWVAAVLGLVTMAPMLAAMLPIFGYAGQARLIEIHGIAALLVVIVMVLHTIVSLAARRVVDEAKGQ